MRNIKHHIIAVTSNDKKAIEELRGQIVQLFKSKMEAKNGYQLITPLFESLINSFYTFYISPDGSKEGYDASEDGDRIRAMVASLIKQTQKECPELYLQYVEVAYGAENEKPSLVL